MVASGTKIPLKRKVVLDEQKLLDLIDRMRVSIPEDVRTARRMVEEKSRILDEAQSEARRIKAELENEVRARLEGNDLVRLAEDRALEISSIAERQASVIIQEADEEARRRCEGADEYALQVLQRLEGQLSGFLTSIHKGIDALDVELRQRAGDGAQAEVGSAAPEARRAKRAGA